MSALPVLCQHCQIPWCNARKGADTDLQMALDVVDGEALHGHELEDPLGGSPIRPPQRAHRGDKAAVELWSPPQPGFLRCVLSRSASICRCIQPVMHVSSSMATMCCSFASLLQTSGLNSHDESIDQPEINS